MIRTSLTAVIAAITLGASALAVTPDEKLSDPKLEARALAVSRELRCVVCQKQSIDDSNAPLAHDMRVIVRERIAAGDSNDDVKAYLVRRYGNFVLLRPPVQANTIALWAGPLAFLLSAAFGFAFFLKNSKNRLSAPVETLSEEEKTRLAAISSEAGA
ncbi:MAG: cytochrome c-type biogenesis protein [Parvularculaceae bacterium]